MKKLLFVVIFIAALPSLYGCETAPKRYNRIYTDVFDTVTEFTAYCSSQEEFDEYAEAVHEELKRLHEIFDIYNEYPEISNAKALNDGAGSPVFVPDELLEVVESGINWNKETDGQLNIALGSVLSIWHDCREREILPDENELKSAGQHTDIEKIKINHENKTVTLSDSDMRLDFGALAKGYAAEKAAILAKNLGADSFALSCGGNIVSVGEKPSGKWEIGIEDPDGGILTSVFVAGEAVVTSGDYQRFFTVDGVRYHHIIDPKTLYPAGLWRSVTVISQSSAEADALSTALFCLDLESGKALAEKYSAEAMWVSADGEIFRTDGFAEYEK